MRVCSSRYDVVVTIAFDGHVETAMCLFIADDVLCVDECVYISHEERWWK